MSVLDDLRARYRAALHAMQSGVAFKKDKKDQEPKHLRVGVNSAHISVDALSRLLIDKGLFNEIELQTALCEAAEREVELYREEIAKERKVSKDRINLA